MLLRSMYTRSGHFYRRLLQRAWQRLPEATDCTGEQPFVLGLSANRLNTDFPEDETVLIQGIIDVYLEEEDGIVLADYKTDLVKDPKELILRYRVQLDYYEEALVRLTGKCVKEKLIYSFGLEQEITL